MLYQITTGLFRAGLKMLANFSVEGANKIPLTGPVILASTHVTNLDPFYLTSACPRQVNFMAKEELFRNPLLGGYLKRIGSFPVHRGTSDRQAIHDAIRVLKAGGILGIFVEGRRNKLNEDLPLKNGAAMLAHRTDAPIVPVKLQVERRQIRVSIGDPIPPHLVEGQTSRKEQYEAINERLSTSFQKLASYT